MQVSFHGSIIKGFFENLTKKESLACIACFYLTTPCCHLSVHRICLQLYWEMPQAPTNRFLDRLNLRYTFPTNRLLTNRQCHADQRLVHVEDLALCRLTPQCALDNLKALFRGHACTYVHDPIHNAKASTDSLASYARQGRLVPLVCRGHMSSGNDLVWTHAACVRGASGKGFQT